ncbi:unnamed protein product [Symbiodinium sp. CCMP2592]|nr:unnamed protein product [Symbiodinium sp. CCMP2592]
MAGTYSLTLGAEPEPDLPNLEEPLQEDSRDMVRGVRMESPRHGQHPLRFLRFSRTTLWTIGLITVAMLTLLMLKAPGLASMLTTKQRGQAPAESEAVIDLYELNINTSHGMVPKKLQVSGVDCGPANSGYAELLNGNYTYEETIDGRPRYKSETAHKLPGTPWLQSWLTTSHHTYLYYSSSNVSSGPYGEWHFLYSSHTDGMNVSELKVTRDPPLLSGPEVGGPAKALPPRRTTWKVMCDDSAGSPTYMDLPLTLHATGKMETTKSCEWRYVNGVLKGGSMSITQGTAGSITDGGSSSQEWGVEVTPEASYNSGSGGAGPGGKLGAAFRYGSKSGSSWEVAKSKSNKVSQYHKWPRDGALFSWTCDVTETTLGTHVETVRTNEYAITDNQGQLPKCCPGWNAGGAADYQKCVAGPELPKCEEDSAARARIAAAEKLSTTPLSVSPHPEAAKVPTSKLMTTTAASTTTTRLPPSSPSPMVNAGKVSLQHVAAETAAATAAAVAAATAAAKEAVSTAMQTSQTRTQLPRPLEGSGEYAHTESSERSARHLKFKGLCVGVEPLRIHSNGAPVQLRPCTEGRSIQWVEDENKLKLMADMTKCLDVVGHNFWSYSPLQIWDCLEDNDDQIVTRQPDGRYQWHNTKHGIFYIDVREGGDTRKSLKWRAVQIWTKGPNQLFST